MRNLRREFPAGNTGEYVMDSLQISRHSRPIARRRCWLPALLCLVLAGRLGAAEFSATLDRETIILGESAKLTLSFKDGQPQQIPTVPAIPNLQINSQGTSQVFNQVNNQLSSVVSHAFALTPTRAGEYQIPALNSVVDGQRLTSRPLKLTVLERDPSGPPAEYADKLAFLWLVLPKTNLYVGEVIVLELRLYLRQGVAHISDVQLPTLAGPGLVVGKYVQGAQFERRLGPSNFTIVPIQTTLMAARAGLLTLSRLNGSVVLHIPSRQRSAFDFLGPPTTTHPVELTLDPISLSTRPLPREGVPATFNGAVGKYELSRSAGPTNLPAGDPITVRVEISGEGALDSLSLPAQAWDGFKTIPPSSSVEYTDSLGVRGRKLFEQIVVPQNDTIRQLPPVTFSFFDPEQNAYRSLSVPAIPLQVRSGGASASPVVAGRNSSTDESGAPTPDIVPIKQRPGFLAEAGTPLLHRPWFIGIQTVPIIAFISAVLWRKRQDALANNPRLRRRQQVAESIRSGLADLRQRAAANDSDGFFATLFRLLQEKLGERLDVPATSITEAIVEERLRPMNTPEQTVSHVHELFQACNLARYAPIKDSQELAAFIPRLESVLRELDALKP